MSYLELLQNQQQVGDRQLIDLGRQPTTAPFQQPSRTEQWHQTLGQLNQNYNQIDAPGQAKLNDLNTKTEALLANRGQLRPDEFDGAMQSIHDTAVDYPWDQHMKPPGSNPGDIVEEDGIRKLTEADGTRKPIAYTPQFMAENSMPIGDTGKVAIPVAPDKPYEIADVKERDLTSERGEIDKAAKGIEKIYTEIAKEQQKVLKKEVLDDDGKVIGILPFTSKERRQMSIMAREAYVKDQLQAKHAAKTITDAGAHELRQAMGGDVSDPYQAEQDMADQAREILMTRQARQEAAGELMKEQGHAPVPTLGPPMPADAQPVQPGAQKYLGQEARSQRLEQIQAQAGGQELDPALQKWIAGGESTGRTPEESAAREIAVQAAKREMQSVVSAPDVPGLMIEAGMVRSPLVASDKVSMKEQYADSPNGTVVALPDGRRYVKDEGKFWQVPKNFMYEHLRSDIMLDAEGNPVIDPNTGEPAPGTVQQIEASRAAGGGMDVRMGGEGYTVDGGPIVPYGEEPAEDEKTAAPEPIPADDRSPSGAVGLHPPREIPPPPALQRLASQSKQPARKPGSVAEAVEPEQTMAASEGVDPNRLPSPAAHQPAVATQEAIAAQVRQRHDRGTKFDPQKVGMKLSDLMKSRKIKASTLLQAPLLQGSPESIEPGEAFRTATGEIYVKIDDGSYEGPFTQGLVRNYLKSQSRERAYRDPNMFDMMVR
jgi:hypothetical protein